MFLNTFLRRIPHQNGTVHCHIIQTPPIPFLNLLRLLPLRLLISRLTPQPNPHKAHPPNNGHPNARNPRPTCTDLPTARPFIVGKVPYSDLSLDVNVREERALVVDAEGEDAVLVGELEGGAEDGAVCSLGDRGEVEAVEGRKHGELKLEGV